MKPKPYNGKIEVDHYKGESHIKKKLMIVTTTPETLISILNGQPEWLNSSFRVVCVSSDKDTLEKVRKLERVPVFPIQMSRNISIFRDINSIISMYRLLRRHEPDIVHSYTPKAGLVSMLAGFLARVPIRIHTFTGLVFPSANGIRRRLLIWVDKLICSCATHVIPEGKGVKADLKRHKITSKPLKVIGAGNIAGVDLKTFLRISSKSSDKPFSFSYVGRLNKDKGIRELCAAFKLLGGECRLNIVGALDVTNPPDKQDLDWLEQAENVIMHGYLSDIRPVLNSTDVIVLPSYREGFPNVLLQAGAMGIPAIATDVNGSNEIIESGLNGWVISPRDIESLYDAMNQALSMEKTKYELMADASYERVKSRYEQGLYRSKLLSFYQKIINEKIN